MNGLSCCRPPLQDTQEDRIVTPVALSHDVALLVLDPFILLYEPGTIVKAQLRPIESLQVEFSSLGHNFDV